MSVEREDNICTITFEDENWKEEAPEVFTVTDGAVPFYTADTWKYNEKIHSEVERSETVRPQRQRSKSSMRKKGY